MVCTFPSANERLLRGEREMADRLKMAFMADKIGESYTAIISGVSDSVLFIELTEHFVNGIVPLSEMSDDYYILDEKRHRIIGDISGKTFQIGDSFTVTLSDIDQHRKKIIFRPL